MEMQGDDDEDGNAEEEDDNETVPSAISRPRFMTTNCLSVWESTV
jgi:hypothetical protein